MLYQNISKYGLATHLALAAALPAALAQFVSASALSVALLWISLAAVVWLIVEPSVLSGETVSRARMRVFTHVLHDPLSWFFLVVWIFSFARWLNSGVRLAFDAEASTWAVKAASASFLPASSGETGFFPLALAVSMGIVAIGVKHALGRNARIWFGLATGAISAIGACIAVVHVGLKAEPFLSMSFAEFGAESFCGTMFALFLPIAIACGVQAEDCGMTKCRLVFAWAVAGNGLGAYFFLPSILSAAYLSIAAVVAIISLVILKVRSGAAAMARAASMLAFGIIIAIFSAILPPFSDVLKAKADGFAAENVFPPALKERNEALSRISKAIWLEHPWSGSGVGSFTLEAPFFADKEEWAVLPPQPSIGSNGFYTLIAERGISGALLWGIGIGLLVYFWCSRLVGSFVWQKQQDEGRSWLMNVPAVVWVGPLVLLVAFADTFFSSNFPLTGMSACVTAAMPLAAAYFPKAKRNADHKDEKG